MHLNLNRLFPWLSIRSKLIIAFAGLSILPVALVGLHAVFSNVRMMESIALENLTHDLQTVREKTSHFLAGVESDLRLMRNSSLMEQLTQKLQTSTDNPRRSLLQQLSRELLSFAQTRGIYYQIRVVAIDGKELLRVETNRIGDSLRSHNIVPLTSLREGRESYYSLLVQDLSADQIAFAPAELVGGENERVPVISFAMPLRSGRHRVGILIANVFAKDLFQVLEGERHLEVTGRVALVSGDGHYVYHSEKKKDWNKLLASRLEDNLEHDYPAEVVAAILSGRDGTARQGIDEIISYGPLFPHGTHRSAGQVSPGFAVPLFVFEAVSKDLIAGPARSFAWKFAGFLLVFLFAAIGLGLLATRQFTRPIAELQRGAEIIAKGNYGNRLRVETHDEIEKLADQFNLMASSLEAREREIQLHRLKLEEMVQQRTQELMEEKARLQAILDNVPSAFVLLDREFRIQTASAAFGAVTGLHLEDVRGLDCARVFCEGGFCRRCVSRDAFASGRIESHVDHAVDPHGNERYIEHIAIPMKEKGRVNSILEIISDITKRKRLEEHLLQTEKLMAAGEMAAIVAHEFRNSLTSIKMILQLQNESKRLNRSDKKSLDVALNSIGHMESIVSELLNFARPRTMKLRPERLDRLIAESIAMARLQVNKKSIVIKTTLDPRLETLVLDGSYFKEALINLLLNAAQAIEANADRNGKGEVLIHTEQIRLQKTLHDFALPSGMETETADLVGKEITLRKGSDCALIEVSDTGCGIDKEHLTRVFDPFFTTKTNGTGLGLPLVKRTVNAHGGVVAVKSKKGRGTTFQIYLPLSNGSDESA